MSAVDWRIYLWGLLRNNAALLDAVPVTSMYAAGTLTGPPENRPFIVIHIGEEFRESFPGVSKTLATVWAHDDTGSYWQIDGILEVVKDALCGPGLTEGRVPTSGGIAIRWNGNGGDQADEALKTLMRRSNYQLIGRD